ncbi:tape measure protein [Acinetobacter beijerinckii]|uniref:tape measure protein n=1 Tax=Acinetobacter beijerinckii TaxID=262668 RepID=UPI0023DDC0C3|nr:tape measure protein [Acinetobacter beijerinckii]MDF2419184.1 tape measure protein [Acinetobacter beijerinckii]
MATNLGTLTLNLLANTGSYTQGLQRAERQTQQSTENMARDYNLVGKTIGELKNTIVGYMAGIVSVGAAIAKMDSYTGLQNRLKLVTASQTELNQAMQDTFSIAQATGQSWDSTAQVYQRFADNAKRLGISFQETALLTDTVAKAISISGGSAASAEAALVQFGQALASGVLRGEEFNSISEQAPGLLKAIATGLNVNIGELRKMANEGQLSADVVVGALEKAKNSVDELFGKTDFTIGNSFTMLSNALTQFVGEAGKGSGAAQLISGSIQSLATNLDVVTNVAMVGTAFYVGSYIPALYSSVAAGYAKTKQLIEQTTVQYATINAERIAAAQALASAQAVVVNTQATLAALAAEKALEVERLKAQMNQAGRIASTTRMAQLRRIEAQVTAELTAAETALAAARARSAAASVTSARVGAGLLGILGGPVGLGLTVASIAAGYLLMSGNGDQANNMLEQQSRYANMATNELAKLSGAQLRAAEQELSSELAAQSGHLQKAKNDFEALTESVLDSNSGNKEAYRIWAELKTGVISTEQAFNKLNQAKFVTPEQINALSDSRSKVIEHETATKNLNEQLDKIKLSGANAASGLKDIGSAAIDARVSVEAFNKAVAQLNDQRTDSQYLLMTSKNLGGDIEKAKELLKYRKELGLGSTGRALNDKERKPFEDSYAALQALKKYEESQKNAEKRIEEAAKKRDASRDKARNDAEKQRQDQAKSRESISFDYADEFNKLNIEYQKAVQDINKANFGAEQSKYLDLAKTRYDFNSEMYLRQLTEENDSFRWSEEYKLEFYYATQKEIVENSGRFNDELKAVRLNSLRDQKAYELAQIKLAQDQRISDAGEMLRTDLQNMEIKYAFERKKIEENAQLSDDERQKRLALLFASEEFQKRQNLNSATAAWGGTYADLTGAGAQYQMEQDRFNKYDESQALFDAQMALAESAAEREAIWQAHNDRMAMIDEDYQTKTAQQNLYFGEQIAGSYADMFKSISGEQSAAYKAMFIAQKSFAISSAILSIKSGIAKAVDLPFPANLAAMATVAATTATLVSDIQSVAGVFHGGTDYVPKESSYLLDKGERVLSPRQNTDLTRYLSNQRQSNSGANINITNNTPAKVSVRQESNGQIGITMDEVEQFVSNSLAQPNSRISKSVSQNTSATRRR